MMLIDAMPVGLPFSPPHLRRAVQQYNLKHGTTPKVPFDSSTLPTPKSATFEPGLRHSAMCLPCATDESSTTGPSDDVLHLSVPGDARGSDNGPLQLRSITTAQEVDAALGELSRDLDASIDKGAVSFAPQLAVLDLSAGTASSSPPTSTPHDLAHPMVVSDYSVHGDQVNC